MTFGRIILAILLLASPVLADGSFTISGTATLVDAARLYKQNPVLQYGKHADLDLGDTFIPQTRTDRFVIRFNTLPDSMITVGAAIWDSARIGLVIDALPDTANRDSLCATAHKITTALWVEGLGTGQDTCGVKWDSANATGYSGCSGSPLDWTSDGGDFSATRETYGSHADSLWISKDIQLEDDTVYFYISSATVSDTMGNKAGILIQHIQFANNADNDCSVIFDSDDQSGKEPFLEVWWSTVGEAAQSPRRRKLLTEGL